MKKLLKIVLGLVVTVIALLLIVPFFIPAEAYKSLLISQVKSMTGRDLAIGGKASLQLFPNVALDVEDVTLSNPAGFADKELTKIGKLSVKVALMPLLDKKLEMKGATLEDATLALEERADGTKSWEMMPAVKGTTEPETATPKDKAAKQDLSNIVLGAIHIKNTKVTYRKADAKPIELANINLDVDSGGLSSKLKADFSAKYQGEDVSVNATIDNPEDFMNGKATAVDLKAKVPQTNVSFKGDAAMASSVIAKGALDASISDLGKLTAWATGKPGAAAPKAIDVKATLAAKNNSYSLSGATITVDGVKATGDIAANLADKVPGINGNLAFGTLDIDAITKKKSSGTASLVSDANAASPEGWSDEPMDLSALRLVNANLGLTAEGVTTGNLKLGKTGAKINLSAGNLNIGNISTALYQGTAAGNLKVDASGATPAIATDFVIKGVQIEPLMTALAGKSRLAGTANLSFNLNGSGKSQRAIMSTLGGKGDMKVTDGAILGINLASFLRNAKKGFLSDSTTERTDFAELSGTFTVASGIVSNKDLAMQAPIVRLTGDGDVNLPNKTVNYHLNPKLTTAVKGQGGDATGTGVTIPLLITGPWSNISIVPDLAAALKDPAALKENLQNAKDAIKNYNSPSDLKKALLGGGKETAPAATTAPAGTTAAPAAQPKPKNDLKNLLKGF